MQQQEQQRQLKCVICGQMNGTTKRIRTTFDEVDLALAECRECGHCYQCPALSKRYAETFYEEAYGSERSKYEYFHPEKKLLHAEQLFGVFRQRCPSAQRILEIGAGAGEFAHVAQKAGCTVLGTETSEAGILSAQQRYGIQLHAGRIQELDVEPFDAAIMWDVIEHCPDPAELLEGVSNVLKPGGELLLTTGNYECAERLASGAKWWCWQGDHYHYFRPSGLKRLGERYGLHNFQFGPVPRLKHTGTAASASPKLSRLRFLNPRHIAKVVKYRSLRLVARCIWPTHWNLGVCLYHMTKAEQST